MVKFIIKRRKNTNIENNNKLNFKNTYQYLLINF